MTKFDVGRTRLGCGRVVPAITPHITTRNAYSPVERRLQGVTADVVEEHVPFFMPRQLLVEIALLVVNSVIKARLVSEPGALLGATRNTDHATAFELGDLPATEPVAPAAPETSTVSPGQIAQIQEANAVRPVTPNTESIISGGAPWAWAQA